MKQFLVLLVIAALTACESLAYYSQAVHGQFTILTKRRGIKDVVNDPSTDNQLRGQLESVLQIRQFAETVMHLPVEKTFSTYVDLEKPFVVWNVFASPEFSLDARQWCYPIAGCVTYRGYFSEAGAREYASELTEDGFDTHVGGVAAYSTLGWFSDPVLNTIVNREEHSLAALIFHELAHQVVYVPGDTEFNESFATAVEIEGLKRWMETGSEKSNSEAIISQAKREKSYREEFVQLVQGYTSQLEDLYISEIPDQDKREQKQRVIEEMRASYLVKKEEWGGYSAYDNWFASEINNAKLRTVSTYFNRVPAFDTLMREVDYDLPLFYARVKEIARMDDTDRNRLLGY